LIVGSGTAYEGFPSGGDPGDVLTSAGVGVLPSWRAPATGNLTVVIPFDSPVTSYTLSGNTTYITYNSSGPTVIFTLPLMADAVPGTFYTIVGGNQIGWQVNVTSGQLIAVGSSSTTIGTGNIQSTTTGFYANESITIWCVAPNYFIVSSVIGTVQVN
jgi:hypothetical protein